MNAALHARDSRAHAHTHAQAHVEARRFARAQKMRDSQGDGPRRGPVKELGGSLRGSLSGGYGRLKGWGNPSQTTADRGNIASKIEVHYASAGPWRASAPTPGPPKFNVAARGDPSPNHINDRKCKEASRCRCLNIEIWGARGASISRGFVGCWRVVCGSGFTCDISSINRTVKGNFMTNGDPQTDILRAPSQWQLCCAAYQSCHTTWTSQHGVVAWCAWPWP